MTLRTRCAFGGGVGVRSRRARGWPPRGDPRSSRGSSRTRASPFPSPSSAASSSATDSPEGCVCRHFRGFSSPRFPPCPLGCCWRTTNVLAYRIRQITTFVKGVDKKTASNWVLARVRSHDLAKLLERFEEIFHLNPR